MEVVYFAISAEWGTVRSEISQRNLIKLRKKKPIWILEEYSCISKRYGILKWSVGKNCIIFGEKEFDKANCMMRTKNANIFLFFKLKESKDEKIVTVCCAPRRFEVQKRQIQIKARASQWSKVTQYENIKLEEPISWIRIWNLFHNASEQKFIEIEMIFSETSPFSLSCGKGM